MISAAAPASVVIFLGKYFYDAAVVDDESNHEDHGQNYD